MNQKRAQCEICGCSWYEPCVNDGLPCSWDPEYWADGRAVCSTPACLEKAKAKK